MGVAAEGDAGLQKVPPPVTATMAAAEAAAPPPGSVGRRPAGSLQTQSYGPSLATVSRRHRPLGTDLLPSLATRSTLTYQRPTGVGGRGGGPARDRRQSADGSDPSAFGGFGGQIPGGPLPLGAHPLAGGIGLRRVVEDVELGGGGGGGRAHPPPAGPAIGAAMAPASQPNVGSIRMPPPPAPATAAAIDLASASIRRAGGPTSYMPTHEAAETYTSLSRLRGVGLYYTGTEWLYYLSTVLWLRCNTICTDICPHIHTCVNCTCSPKLTPPPCTESPHGIPPVMWHFLRNVEAVHELVILLQNRFLPIPHLDEADRFAGVPIPGLPNFYRVSECGGRGAGVPIPGRPNFYRGHTHGLGGGGCIHGRWAEWRNLCRHAQRSVNAS